MEGTLETAHERPSRGSNPRNKPDLSPKNILLGLVTQLFSSSGNKPVTVICLFS